MENIVKFRPHHVESLIEYSENPSLWIARGLVDGYGEETLRKATEIVEKLLKDSTLKVKLVNGLDDICIICPFAERNNCNGSLRRDVRILRDHNLEIGKEYSVAEIFEIFKDVYACD